MKKVEVFLPYPPTVNQLYLNAAGKGRVKTPKYREWITKASACVGVQAPVRTTGWVTLDIQVIKPDGRKRDIMNLEKAVSDLLCVHKILEDDSFITLGQLCWVKLETTKYPKLDIFGEQVQTMCRVVVRECEEYDQGL